MIRLSLLAISLFSLIYGSIFLFFPEWFIDLSKAEKTNVAWLRNVGASIIGILFFGCFRIYYKPYRNLTLLKIITITSILQTLSLIYSRLYNEFSATNLIVVDLSIFLAIFVCFFFLWLVTYKSYKFR